jgi:hypothetical protein
MLQLKVRCFHRQRVECTVKGGYEMWLRQALILGACLVFDKLAGHAVGLLYARRALVLSSRLRHCWQRIHENELAASGGMRGRLPIGCAV